MLRTNQRYQQPALISNVNAMPEEQRRPLAQASFAAGKLRVRGLFRTTCLIVVSAAMTNVHRIQRYLQATRSAAPESHGNRRKPHDSLRPAPASYFPAVVLNVAQSACPLWGRCAPHSSC